MSEQDTDNKLGSQPVLEKDSKTSPLKFTDYSVQKFTSNFIGTNGKIRPKVFTPFGFKSGSLKGLGLFQWYSTKAKFFTRRVHLKTTGKDFYWYIGNISTMTVKECEEKITNIYKTHTDDRGHWIKDPRLTSKENERVIVKKVVEEAQKKTINEVIEILHKQEFPRSKASGKLDFKSAKVYSRYLLGYNKRHQHLEFINDNKGNGKINLKANYHFRTAKPDSFDSLFKRYPAGTGKLKDTKEISLYDSDLGKTFISDLKEDDVVGFLNSRQRSYGVKVNIKRAIAVLWNFARNERLLSGNPINPTLFTIKKDEEEDTSFKGSMYNHKRFNNSELEQIYGKLIEARQRFAFQSECLMLILATGIREETAKQIRWSMVQESSGIIRLPKTILKGRKKGMDIIITQPVQTILDLIKDQLNTNYKKYKFVDWLFPTTRIDSKRLNEDGYINSHHTRLATLKGAWSFVRDELSDMVGSPKMFRKSFVRISKLELGTNAKVKVLTGHTQDSTIDTYYDKHDIEEQKESAKKVSKVYSFIKK